MSKRISWLDGWRGIACYLMLVYHLLFDLLLFGWVGWDTIFSWPVVLLEKFIAYSFILCAGISAEFTHSNLRRGLITLAAGALVVAASFVVGAPILFGVLQFLGFAMVIHAGVGKYLARVPEKWATALWMVLFVITYVWTANTVVQTKALFWLGFVYDGFTSYDYFPMMPYIFLFWAGSSLGRIIRHHRDEMPFLDKQAPRWLTWPGQHTLWIYLLHQPVLFGACMLVHMVV
jgi:uncharacterized membrane protein